jgi:vacuolar-type H+-ATPase subunit C/Vma6
MLEGLIAELARISPEAGPRLAHYPKLWVSLSEERKRELLRMFVGAIRDIRNAAIREERVRIASMLELGPEGLIEVFQLDPEIALIKAEETLMAMSASKEALAFLSDLKLDEQVEGTMAALTSADQRKTAEQFKTGLTALVDKLQTNIVTGGLLLTGYLSRAGGVEMSEKDEAQVRAMFDQIDQGGQPPEAN